MDNEKNEMIDGDDSIEFTADLITLTDEDGEEHVFELVDTLEHGGENYVALVAYHEEPEEVLEDDGDLVIMKIISEENGEEILEIIEDDDEFDEISEIFLDRLSDLYDFDEEDEND